jgi:Cof subfamily protein (haloacid dehalogenase superfamily)
MNQNICHRDIKLILLDLDGTLLTSDKKISDTNRAALEEAAAKGIFIVPCTGRFFAGMPEEVRALPFIHYAITINGADVYDALEQRTLHSALISLPKAHEVYSVLDTLPVIYDCFQDGWGWIDQKFYDIADQYEMGEVQASWIRRMRTPLEDLRQTLDQRNKAVQKIQMFFRPQDMDLRARMLTELPHRLPGLSVTTSLVNNIEINSGDAHKGAALLELCRHLNIDPAQAMAFGDGLNDVTMIKTAGIGVAMGNADPLVKDVADFVTDTNDNDGVAKAILRFCFDKE